MEICLKKKNLLPLIRPNNLMDVLPILMNVEQKKSFQLTPSSFIQEMTLTTEERLKKAVTPYRKRKVIGSYNSHLSFVPNPSLIVFQSFEPSRVYSVMLQVRNSKKILMPLKMICPESPYFTAKFANGPTYRVAPGLSAEYNIQFTPDEKKDYNHYLKFEAEDEVFYVPIIAIGPRALLDIPDEITLHEAAVKIPCVKLVMVRNIGNAPAVFTLITKGVEPSKSFLGVQEVMQLSVVFESSKVGEYSEDLLIKFETGEILTIKLFGTSENINVRLEKSSVINDDTFLGLKRHKMIRLFNNSSNVIKFSWKRNQTLDEDLEIIEKIKCKYEELKDFEQLRDTKLKHFEVCNSEMHRASLERVFQDEIQSLYHEEFRFQNDVFTIIPEKGEIWPNGSAEITVTFQPIVCGFVDSQAYCEVSGCEERLSLKIKGRGIGPKITLSVEVLDIDFIFLCSQHKYEIVAANKGHIPGVIEFCPEPSTFGGKIEVTPISIHLQPEEHGVFILTYSSNRQGDFTEMLKFVIPESQEVINVKLKGKIVSPTLHFDKNLIDFGNIAVGLPSVQEITLSNMSMVPVTFSLRIPNDGFQPSLSFAQFAESSQKPVLPKFPQEFAIDPVEGVVDSLSNQVVEITLTSNQARKWTTSLMVDMWDSESETVSCPIRYQSQIANIVVEPSVISIPFCFINFPYNRSVTIQNKSRVPGFFYIVPQDPNDSSSILCSPSIAQGVLPHRDSVKISLSIIVGVLGRQTMPLSILVFGNESPFEECSITCVGQGPVVTLTPTGIDWRELNLLEQSSREMIVANESPIPASFVASMTKPHSPWKVTPVSCSLAPEERITLTLQLCLRDRGKYYDTLKLHIQNSKTLTASLAAVGIGCCLVMTPDIGSKYSMGTLFSNKKYVVSIQLKNEGTKPTSLLWCPSSDYKTFASSKFAYPADSVFKLEPPKLDLAGGECKTLELAAQSSIPGQCSQTFFCYTNVSSPTRDLQLVSEVVAQFVEPLILFDKNELMFWYNIGPDGIDDKLEDKIDVTNTSVLPVVVHIEINYPFCLKSKFGENVHTGEINLKGNETQTLIVKFQAQEQSDRYSRVFKENLNVIFKDHSKKSSVALCGEVNYPNVVILPRKIDFDCIPLCSHAYRDFFLVNCSPVPVVFRFTLDPQGTTIEYLSTHDTNTNNHTTSLKLQHLEHMASENSQDIVEEFESEVRVYMYDNDHLGSHPSGLRHQLELTEELKPPEPPTAKMPDITILPEEVKQALFPLARSYYTCQEELISAFQMAKSLNAANLESRPDYSKICDLTPLCGKLEKFESQVITVRFSPECPISLHAEAWLTIEKGPTEIISIDAQAAAISFLLDKYSIDFGRQLFCEASTQRLRIRNTGPLAFDFEANTVNAVSYDWSELPIKAGVLVITPRSGHVQAKSDFVLLARYHPISPGKFEEKFTLTIGHLNPITIPVSGFGVFPQIHISLPRSEMENIPAEVGYAAVSSITNDWRLTNMEVRIVGLSLPLKPYLSEETIAADKELEQAGIFDDWDFIKDIDCVPSEIDIQLAIERIMAINLVSSDPRRGSYFAAYSKIIPNFLVPSYEVDCGVVMIGRSAEVNAMVTNYGPLPALMHLVYEKKLKEEGIRVRVKNHYELKSGVAILLTVTFAPKKNRYKLRREEVENIFHFQIYHGSKIPVKVLATVTYPYVTPSVHVMDFGDVKCGLLKIMSLRLKNPGLVACKWELMFHITPQELTVMQENGTNDGRPMFQLNYTRGVLQTAEYCSIQITFKPNHGGIFTAYLRVKMEDSLEDLRITLTGEGVEPALTISTASIDFGPTLPYPNKCDKYFEIHNTSPFPVEFYFPSLDDQIFEEERILRAVMLYYQVEELILPVRHPGDSLPFEIVDFYHMLLDELNLKYIDEERERREHMEESVPSLTSFDDDSTVVSSQLLSDRKKKKIKRFKSRSHSNSESLKGTASVSSMSEPAAPNLFEDKTAEEIEEMLHDYLRELSLKVQLHDPVKAAIKASLPPLSGESTEPREGTLVIFHGAPFTNSIQIGNRAALLINKPALSVDRIVLEEAAAGRCDAGRSVRDLIDQAYSDYVERPPSPRANLFPELENIATEEESTAPSFYEVYEEMKRKFSALTALRQSLLQPVKPMKGKGLDSDLVSGKKSGKSDKSQAPGGNLLKTMNPNSPIANITDNLVLEILKYRVPLEVEDGVVIEKLDSEIIINQHMTVLSQLLKAAGNIKNILVIILTNTYTAHNHLVMDQAASEEQQACYLKEERLRILEHESEEDFDNLGLNDDEAKEIREFFLEKRRQSSGSFIRKRDERFHVIRLRRDAMKQNFPVPPMPLSQRQERLAEMRRQKEEKERQELLLLTKKPSPISAKSAKKSGGDLKGKGKKDQLELEFDSFQSELEEINLFLEGWDRRLGVSIAQKSKEPPTKGQTPRKPSVNESDLSAKTKAARGVSLWLVDNREPGKLVAESVCLFLRNVMKSYRRPSESDDWPLLTTDSIMFSVVPKPTVRTRPDLQLNMFILSPVDRFPTPYHSLEEPREVTENAPALFSSVKPKRAESQTSIKSKRKGSAGHRRRRVDSRASNDSRGLKTKRSLSVSVAESKTMKPRWTLQAGEKMSWRVKFYPTQSGKSEQVYTMNLVLWKNTYEVRCSGICDLPAIDMTPEIMFNQVADVKPDNLIYTPTFFYFNRTFDFGSAIPCPTKAEGSKNRYAVFHLLNKSTLPADLRIVFAEDALREVQIGSPHFEFYPQNAHLEPGETCFLTLLASPTKLGPLPEMLMLLVKDSPKIETIRVKCHGVKVNVSVEPKSINFDRILLMRRDVRSVIVTNNNLLPLRFSLSGHEQFPSQFSFSAVQGVVQPLTSSTVNIYYEASEIEVVEELPIKIDVFNTDNDEVVHSSNVLVSAETYDALVDVYFATRIDDHVDFGDIKVENNYKTNIHLKNEGKYTLCYKIDIDYDLLLTSGVDTFFVSPCEGKLLTGTLTPVAVSCVVRNALEWNRLPLFKIRIIEPYRDDELVAVIPIDVSLRSHFSKCIIQPLPDCNLGPIKVLTQKSAPLTIENKGQFPVFYTISAKCESTDFIEDELKSSRRISERSKMQMLGDLKTGAFDISPASGIIQMKETRVIHITCSPKEVKSLEENVIIHVSESPPHLKRGSYLKILAEGCLPTINFDDFKGIFREHYVHANENDANCLFESTCHTTFMMDKKKLTFKNVCVGKTLEARIHLQNTGQIDCRMNFSLLKTTDKNPKAPPQFDTTHFKVTPSELIIEPYTSGTITVSFSPDAMESYKGYLAMKLEMPPTYHPVTCGIVLCGDGFMPQVEIVDPLIRCSNGEVLVVLPLATPGCTRISPISFKNVGVVACKVIIELYKNEDEVFALTPTTQAQKMLKMRDLSQLITNTTILSMLPNQVATFNVIFSPTQAKSYACDIKLFVVDNPFENLCFKLKGDAIFEEVVIEEIRRSFESPGNDENSTRENFQAGPGKYFFHFGSCFMKKKEIVILRLTNRTDSTYFKFNWEDLIYMTVCPKIGHLYPKSYKDVVVTFFPEEGVELEEAPLQCNLSKIKLKHGPIDPSWDDRLIQYQVLPIQQQIQSTSSKTSTRNKNHFEKVMVSGHEPESDILPESNSELTVYISAIADYARLSCEADHISFEDTFMFQTRSFSLKLENTGSVELSYNLELKSVSYGPLKSNIAVQTNPAAAANALKLFNRPKTASAGPCPCIRDRDNFCEQPRGRCYGRPRPLTTESIIIFRNSDAEGYDDNQACENSCTYKDYVAYNPFQLQNSSAHILPKQSATCQINFAPLDVNEYKAIVKITVPNHNPDCLLPEIRVTARSIMPYCHFDVVESDYVSSGRRDYSLPGPIGYAPGLPLDSDTKVIEVEVLGIGFTSSIKFHVINPTDEDYTYAWTNVSQIQTDVVPSFHCGNLDGRIQAGRQKQMIFTFVSQKIGVTESFWKFKISRFNVATPFLLVGIVREALIRFHANHINMTPTVIGGCSVATLILSNHEEVPFDFSFVPDSLFCEGRTDRLEVEPSSGTIAAHSEMSMRVQFIAKTSGKLLFNVHCKVKKIFKSFTIIVETLTYSVQPLITFEDLSKIKRFVSLNEENVIDFGSKLSPNHPESIQLTFTSAGKTSFYYEWVYDQSCLKKSCCRIKFSVVDGHVTALSRSTCDMTIIFFKKSTIKNFPVRLKISKGPTFNFLINASASTPNFEFSFGHHDFGYCFVQQKDVCFYEAPLVFTNKDDIKLTLDCLLHEISAFSCHLSGETVEPGKQLIIPITFHPRKMTIYRDAIKFTVNSIYDQFVTLSGHGTDFKVTLLNAEDTKISFGAVRVGRKTTRQFSLVNRSLAPATLIVGFYEQFPVDCLHLARPSENPININEDHRLSNVFTITPSKPFVVKPQEVRAVHVEYSPKERATLFSETICMQFQEQFEPLCVVSGCCIGAKFSLDRNYLSFGAVVAMCSSTLKLKLINSGDIGARFTWLTSVLGNDFSISPSSGYVSAESDVTISVTFQPMKIASSIRKIVECQLSLSPTESYDPLHLKITGDCVDLPKPIETLDFKCMVRSTDEKLIEIHNRTGNEWLILPIVTGEYFKGFEAITVPQLSSSKYEITYCPLEMTKSPGVHNGSAFFRLPDGRGLLYEFSGTALPPAAKEIIKREVPCKTKYTELLRVTNWLHYPQRFKAIISCTENENSDDPVFTCTGFENLDLGALSEKVYNLNFFAYKTGKLRFNVTFLNESSKEYQWYDIFFHVVMCQPLELIKLKARVRNPCYHELKLENPLRSSVFYTLDCSSPDVHFSRNHTVPAESYIYVKLTFIPIHSAEKTATLNANCPELGIFPRELHLTSVPPPPEPLVSFEAALGGSQTQDIRIKNLSNLLATLNCRTNSDEFKVGDQVTVQAGQEATVNVTYEPSSMNSSSGNLYVVSEQAGNFQYPLRGMPLKPVAIGPFVIMPGSGIFITFKNVLKEAKSFQMYVDNPAFTLQTSEVEILPKNEYKIHLGMQQLKYLEQLEVNRDQGINPRFPIMGQLVVECLNPYIKWQFYLKGVLDKGSPV